MYNKKCLLEMQTKLLHKREIVEATERAQGVSTLATCPDAMSLTL